MKTKDSEKIVAFSDSDFCAVLLEAVLLEYDDDIINRVISEADSDMPVFIGTCRSPHAYIPDFGACALDSVKILAFCRKVGIFLEEVFSTFYRSRVPGSKNILAILTE